jgi:hypothetical protein
MLCTRKKPGAHKEHPVRSSPRESKERLYQNRCSLVEQTVYRAPNVKMIPAEARRLFWFELFPVKKLGKRVST